MWHTMYRVIYLMTGCVFPAWHYITFEMPAQLYKMQKLFVDDWSSLQSVTATRIEQVYTETGATKKFSRVVFWWVRAGCNGWDILQYYKWNSPYPTASPKTLICYLLSALILVTRNTWTGSPAFHGQKQSMSFIYSRENMKKPLIFCEKGFFRGPSWQSATMINTRQKVYS